jgi:hypothetical protein
VRRHCNAAVASRASANGCASRCDADLR